ncbi:MAG: hypothetical protein JWM26_3817 [Betaproteobacteria bacterium]|jgi:hypothetical protein|nr:hypothetical protein [Betaproteobacteria bacterium]
MQSTMAHPNKTAGRVVLGPRQVRSGYARIVAISDGSGRIEIFDSKSGSWCDAVGECTFGEIWSASPVFDSRYLRVLSCMPDC